MKIKYPYSLQRWVASAFTGNRRSIRFGTGISSERQRRILAGEEDPKDEEIRTLAWWFNVSEKTMREAIDDGRLHHAGMKLLT